MIKQPYITKFSSFPCQFLVNDTRERGVQEKFIRPDIWGREIQKISFSERRLNDSLQDYCIGDIYQYN